MEIFPAIDLKEGCVVRLNKGEMQSAKIYGENPLEFAKMIENFGAKWLHVVDLDGAFAGKDQNLKSIEEIVKNTSLNVEVGGGIRDEEAIKKYINLGVKRVILGSVALKNPNFVKEMAQIYRIVVGIDAKNGRVATQGWADISETTALELAREYANSAVEAIICTDISKDGMLCGANVKFSEDIADASGICTIVSGGVSEISELKSMVQNPKIGGVIIGKAFYEGKIDLKEALKLSKN